jgi:hypothetical protein
MILTLDCKNHPQVSRFGASRGFYWAELDLRQPVASAKTAHRHKVSAIGLAAHEHMEMNDSDDR